MKKLCKQGEGVNPLCISNTPVQHGRNKLDFEPKSGECFRWLRAQCVRQTTLEFELIALKPCLSDYLWDM